jgi:hypothetical protein
MMAAARTHVFLLHPRRWAAAYSYWLHSDRSEAYVFSTTLVLQVPWLRQQTEVSKDTISIII